MLNDDSVFSWDGWKKIQSGVLFNAYVYTVNRNFLTVGIAQYFTASSILYILNELKLV